jgi:hypothetical protein
MQQQSDGKFVLVSILILRTRLPYGVPDRLYMESVQDDVVFGKCNFSMAVTQWFVVDL